MAAGEYVSVGSQANTEKADLTASVESMRVMKNLNEPSLRTFTWAEDSNSISQIKSPNSQWNMTRFPPKHEMNLVRRKYTVHVLLGGSGICYIQASAAQGGKIQHRYASDRTMIQTFKWSLPVTCCDFMRLAELAAKNCNSSDVF